MKKKKIIFFAHAVTFAHLIRPLRCIESIDLNQYEVYLATSLNLKKYVPQKGVTFLETSCIDPDIFSKIVDQAKPIYDSKTFQLHVVEDLRILEQVKPDLVFGDFRHSLSVSCRLKKVKYINISNAYWSPELSSKFPIPEAPIIRILGVSIYKLFFHFFTPFFTQLSFFRMAFKIRRSTKHAGFNFFDYRNVIIDGDVTMFCESSELVSLKHQKPNQVFIGPLIWSTGNPLPNWWQNLDKKKRRVFVSLGSSGDISVLPIILSTLSKMDLQVVVALSGKTIEIPKYENVFIANLLPLKEIMGEFSLVICNGGSPMTHMALASGVPTIGVVCNNDQLLNMTHVERRSAGVLLRYWNISEKVLEKAIIATLDNKQFREAAAQIQKEFASQNITEKINEIIEKNISK